MRPDIPCVVGLDLSEKATGIVVRPSAEDVIPFIVRRDDKLKISHMEQQQRVFSGIMKAFREGDLVIQEDYGFARTGAAIHSIELGGLVKHGIWIRTGSQPILVPPSTLKKFVLGKGVGEKNEMMKAVFKEWHVDLQTSHENDAYALSEIGCVLVNWSFNRNKAKARSEVIKVVQELNKDKLSAVTRFIRENEESFK